MKSHTKGFLLSGVLGLICSLAVAVMAPSPAAAFLTDMPVMDKADIAKLTDDKLIEKYIDVMIELEASQTFHESAGFNNPNEYKKFKDLLRFRTYLFLEIKKRELDIPQTKP